ncbi:MAG: gamma carbonic anhydrase family protein [Burkholderiales bacterium]|jgi:carbonic anhydrase/acetyltransferase-like protein (isoleucine patch superfamily)|nr:gamma carbonic anhydrase family protein [Burkholderiales bacterium]
MAIYQLDDRVPQIDPSAFVFDNACVIGLVTLGAGVNVWPFATLRGDNEPIVLGAGSNVQECCVLHTDPGCPLTVGENVTIGHNAVLHGCTVGDGSLIGIGAVILNRAVIGKDCLVGAGALVTEGKVIPDHSLVLGSPAKVVRELRAEDIAAMRTNTAGYVTRGAHFKTALKRLDRP